MTQAPLSGPAGFPINQDRLDWYDGPARPRSMTVRQIDGFWVVKNSGIYRTVDALLARQHEMLDAYEMREIDTLRFGFLLKSRHEDRRSLWCKARDFVPDDL